MAEERVTIIIDGVRWSGWKSCQVARGVDSMAGAFSLGLCDRWQEGASPVPLAPGMKCRVCAGEDTLITGYIDTVENSISHAEHGITVTGRDASADLVDCSAVHAPGLWKGSSLLGIASAIAAPFGVPVALEAGDGGDVPSFAIEPGESAAEAMQRLIKERELLAMPDGLGGLRLAKMGAKSSSTVLAQGVNVLEATARYDGTRRYSRYICTGQKQGSDSAFGKACSVRGEVQDGEVARYRPLLLRPSHQGSAAFMRQRALWEMNCRRAASAAVSVKVQGWRDDDGYLWEPGSMAEASIPCLGLACSLLIASVTFSQGAEGSTAVLELRDKASYAQEPKEAQGSGAEASGGSWKVWVEQEKAAKKAAAAQKDFV